MLYLPLPPSYRIIVLSQRTADRSEIKNKKSRVVGPTVSTPVRKHKVPHKRRPTLAVSPPTRGAQREVQENVMLCPVTETVAETGRAPQNPDRAVRQQE